MSGTVQRFEDLIVYQKAQALVKEIYALTRKGAFAKDFVLIDQIRRAAVSVVSNIAEGFERGNNSEFAQFLSIAKGSCGEMRAQLAVAAGQGYMSEKEHESLADASRHIGIMLSHLTDTLKASSYKGRRYMKSRENH